MVASSERLNIFHESKVLITGHTGFKGSWLASWLYQLGAQVTGVALGPPTDPSHFEVIALHELIDSHNLDLFG